MTRPGFAYAAAMRQLRGFHIGRPHKGEGGVHKYTKFADRQYVDFTDREGEGPRG